MKETKILQHLQNTIEFKTINYKDYSLLTLVLLHQNNFFIN